MKFEEVLPAFRCGKKIRSKTKAHLFDYLVLDSEGLVIDCSGFRSSETYVDCILRDLDDWEIVKETKHMAKYLVPISAHNYLYEKQEHEMGKEPIFSVMMPGTEYEQEQD
jgi:hypothetical protein